MISPDMPTLGSLFKQSGYDAARVGNWQLGIGEKKRLE